jgi:glycosyltransferase involved in cell wall biosynthesis
MLETVQRLADLTALHLIVLLDRPEQQADHAGLAAQACSASFLARMPGRPKGIGSIEPHAIREFSNQDLEWLIHRTIYLEAIDVVQLEYLPMAQYRGDYRQIACLLFEHDIYFQSLARQLPGMDGLTKKAAAAFEYLRALRYELRTLPKLDRVQVCSPANTKYLMEFLPEMRGRLDDDQRAGIRPSKYEFRLNEREPDTMLFLGSFRHAPNMEALQWFTRMVMPHVLTRRPSAKLVLVGSDPPPRHSLPDYGPALEFRGFVEDVTEPLRRYSVFVCPILSGSGVRVKLLEAFAAGIPVVSTRIGAEGLIDGDGSVCLLADEPVEFAERVLELLGNPKRREELATRARAEVESRWDLSTATLRLLETYRAEVERKRSANLRSGKPPME